MPGLNPEEKQQKSVFGDEQTQEMLNKPVADTAGKDVLNQEFLDLLVKLIEEKQIDLYKPSTLLNQGHYDTLSDEAKGKADFECVNMLAAIREIYELYKNGFVDSYQIKNQVERLRLQKERAEELGGDIFII